MRTWKHCVLNLVIMFSMQESAAYVCVRLILLRSWRSACMCMSVLVADPVSCQQYPSQNTDHFCYTTIMLSVSTNCAASSICIVCTSSVFFGLLCQVVVPLSAPILYDRPKQREIHSFFDFCRQDFNFLLVTSPYDLGPRDWQQQQ